MVDVANFAARNFGYGPDLANIDLARNRNALAQQEIAMGPLRQQALQQQIGQEAAIDPLRQQYLQQQIASGAAQESRINQQSAAADQAQKITWLAGASRYALQHPESWDYVVQEGKQRGIIPQNFNAPHDPQKLQDFVNQIEVMSGAPKEPLTIVPKESTALGAGGQVVYQGQPDQGNVNWVHSNDQLVPTYSKTGGAVPGLKPMPAPLNPAAAAAAGFTGPVGDLMAALSARGYALPAGMRSKEQQLATFQGLLRRYPTMSPDEVADNIVSGKLSLMSETQAVNEYNSSRVGTAGGTINAINTAVKHIDSALPLVDAMGTGDVRVFNQAKNAFEYQTGSTAPTDYNALKEFIGGEISKAVFAGGGGEQERQDLQASLNAANSPQQIKSALQKMQVALAGKTDALRNQWNTATNGKQGQFDKFLLPETKKALAVAGGQQGARAAPAIPLQNQNGWVLHQDAQGNKAYVNPQNPSQFEEVK